MLISKSFASNFHMSSLSDMTDVQLILDFIPQLANIFGVTVATAVVIWHLNSAMLPTCPVDPQMTLFT
jgi:hypothetical protein